MYDKLGDIERRDFDIFNVWDVNDLGLALPDSDIPGETMIPKFENRQAFAGAFGNEFLPLVMDAQDSGIDVYDRNAVYEWFELSGYTEWLDTIKNTPDAGWREIITDYIEPGHGAMAARIEQLVGRDVGHGAGQSVLSKIAKSKLMSNLGVINSRTSLEAKLLQKGAQIKVFDNGGETMDRYTVFIDNDVFGMSDDPGSPQGFNQHIGDASEIQPGPHLGQEIDAASLPDEVKRAIGDRGGKIAGRKIALQYQEAIDYAKQKAEIEDVQVYVVFDRNAKNFTNTEYAVCTAPGYEQWRDSQIAAGFDFQIEKIIEPDGAVKEARRTAFQGAYFKQRALRCWELMDDSEKAAVRFGMSPSWTTEENLGGRADPGEGHSVLEGADDYRKAAVALMDVAKEQGGMIASFRKKGQWAGWRDVECVQVVTTVGGGQLDTEYFENLDQARQKYPTLDPEHNTKDFSWAMRGYNYENTAPCMRFEDWGSYDVLST